MAVAAPAECTVGSEECVPAGSEGCDANAATKAAAQKGALDAAMQAAVLEAAMWAVASVTGTQTAARGAVPRVEAVRRSRTLSVRELVTP